MKKINLEYSNIPVLYPDIQWIIGKIMSKESFIFLKINHGILDQIHLAYEHDYIQFEIDFLNNDYSKIADKIVKNSHKDINDSFYHYHNNSNKLKDVLIIFLYLLKHYKKYSNKLHIGLSLGVGLNTFWGVWPEQHPYQVGRLELAKIIYKNSKNDFYYSGVLKHYAIKQEIVNLFKMLNAEKYKVIFLGPSYLSLYKDVFQIEKFKHIEIPSRGAIETIESQIFQIKKEIKGKTILFHSTGHLISSYLIYHLARFNIDIIDIGRSFDIYLNEYNENYKIPPCWTGLDIQSLNNYVDDIRK